MVDATVMILLEGATPEWYNPMGLAVKHQQGKSVLNHRTGSNPVLTTIINKMRIYQLKTAKEFFNTIEGNFSTEELMQMYAEDVAKRFAAECVNQALQNKMGVSNALYHAIEGKYKSIIWENNGDY